jgi:hypothetical protein
MEDFKKGSKEYGEKLQFDFYTAGLELLEYKKQEKATALEKEFLDLLASKTELCIKIFIESVKVAQVSKNLIVGVQKLNN